MKTNLLLAGFLLATFLGAVAPANSWAASVGPAGYFNDFSTQPAAADWSTYSVPGGSATYYLADQLDSAVAKLRAADFTAQVVSNAYDPAAWNILATWSSSGLYLQTRPSANGFTVLMATFVNNTGAEASSVTISYDFATNNWISEEIKGQRVYCSLTGATNSWSNIAALSSTPPGHLLATVPLSSTWSNGSTLYLLWADDNGSGNPDGANQIDSFFIFAGPVLPAATHYVDAASTNPIPPYTNWATAAAVIQDAVEAAAFGDTVLVTNGVYARGGRALAAYPLMTNRVCVDRAITLRSVNGPKVTAILGQRVEGTNNGCGDGAIRCVFLTSNAVLSGFTVTNGATRTQGNQDEELNGGGVYCVAVNSAITNSLIIGNSASMWGGGAFRGTLNNCTMGGNSAMGGGGASGSASMFDCLLNNCLLTGNTAREAISGGGGALLSELHNCTVVGNWAVTYGGGVDWSSIYNCIIYYNEVMKLEGTIGANHATLKYASNCCTVPLPEAPFFPPAGMISNEPCFVDFAGGNLRLQTNSPCINAGNNDYAGGRTDLDGNPRIAGGTVDIGAYEFQGVGAFVAWLQGYGLPTDGTAHFTDPDGDGFNNYQEYRCGTDPTNALSALRLLPPAPAGTNLTLAWPSATGRSYVLECSTNLGATPPFFPLATNLPGQPGATRFTVTNPAAWGPNFYRVFVP